jgi:multiple sugar transport system substrate-binding protein
MKKVIVSILLLSVVFSVFARGSSEEKMPEKAKLVFWDMQWETSVPYAEDAKALVAKYNASQDKVEVQYQSIPWADYNQVFLTAVQGGAAPDVATGGSQIPINYYLMGEILPLDSIVAEWKADKTYDEYIPGIVESNYYDGHYIALPWHCDPRSIMYRTDLFEAAGITKLPTTWNELLGVLRTLKKAYPDMVPLAGFGNLQGAQQFADFFLNSNGGGQVTADMKANFNSKEVRETLEFIATLSDEGLIPEGMIAYEQADSERLFLSGKAICLIPASATGLADEKLKNLVDIMDPIQGPSADKPYTLYWANSICAFSQTKHPEEAKNFIKWWLDNQKTLFVDTQMPKVPARVTFMDDKFFIENVMMKAYTQVLYPTFRHATSPITGFFPAYGEINGQRYLGMAAQKVLSGDRNYDAILAEGQAKIQGAIDAVK